jgi:hypothetical protein
MWVPNFVDKHIMISRRAFDGHPDSYQEGYRLHIGIDIGSNAELTDFKRERAVVTIPQ